MIIISLRLYSAIFGHRQTCVELFLPPLNNVLAPSPGHLQYYCVALEENPVTSLCDENTSIMPQTNLYSILFLKEGHWEKTKLGSLMGCYLLGYNQSVHITKIQISTKESCLENQTKAEQQHCL